jgi:hypothetical protein
MRRAILVLLCLCAGGLHAARATAVHELQASVALPEGKARDGAVRFVAMGDTGTGGKAQLAIARRLSIFHDERPYDTVVLLGDNVYPKGNPAGLVEKFERPYADLLRRGVRFRAVLGNHDVSQGREAQTKYDKFNMGGRSYYSFTKGDDLLEIFAVDSTRIDQAQLDWLDKELGSSKARWKVVAMHHPLYSSGRAHGSNARLQRLLEPLFVRHRVTAVFAGHDHVYERSRPQKGVQYFTSGAGGKLRRGDLDRTDPIFASGNDKVHSFMFVEVTRERFSFWAVDAEGRILDSGILTRNEKSSHRSGPCLQCPDAHAAARNAGQENAEARFRSPPF